MIEGLGTAADLDLVDKLTFDLAGPGSLDDLLHSSALLVFLNAQLYDSLRLSMQHLKHRMDPPQQIITVADSVLASPRILCGAFHDSEAHADGQPVQVSPGFGTVGINDGAEHGDRLLQPVVDDQIAVL